MPAGIGLDAGEGVPLEGGYRGGALNLAARLCGQAGPGEILASRSVTHLARRVEGVRYVDRGKVQLKNLPDPVELVRILPEGVDPAARLRTALPPTGPARRRSRARILRRCVGRPRDRGRRHDRPAPRRERADDRGGSGGVPQLTRGTSKARWMSASSRGDSPREPGGSGSPIKRATGCSRSMRRPSRWRSRSRWAPGRPASRSPKASCGSPTPTTERSRWSTRRRTGVVQTVVVGNGPAGIVADGARVWVANSVDATVTEIDATDGSVVKTYPVGERPVALAVADGAVWVANASDGTMSRVVSGDGETGTTNVGRGPASIESAFGSLWVANAEDGTLTTIDSATGSMTTERVGEGADALASAGGSIWVASAREGTIVRIDPATRGDGLRSKSGTNPEPSRGSRAGCGSASRRRRPTIGEGRFGSWRSGRWKSIRTWASFVSTRRARIDVRRPRDVSACRGCRRSDGGSGSGRVTPGADRRGPHVHVHAPRWDPVLERAHARAAGCRCDLRTRAGREQVRLRLNVSELVGWSTCTPEDPRRATCPRASCPTRRREP